MFEEVGGFGAVELDGAEAELGGVQERGVGVGVSSWVFFLNRRSSQAMRFFAQVEK